VGTGSEEHYDVILKQAGWKHDYLLAHVFAVCGVRCVQAFADIKNYYNDITHNNLDLIKSLKEDVHEMKKKEQQVRCNQTDMHSG
jgi:hypothetical protein